MERVIAMGSGGLANHTVLLARDARVTTSPTALRPIRNGQGRMQGVCWCFADVSEENTNCADALATVELHFRALANSDRRWVLTCGLDGG